MWLKNKIFSANKNWNCDIFGMLTAAMEPAFGNCPYRTFSNQTSFLLSCNLHKTGEFILEYLILNFYEEILKLSLITLLMIFDSNFNREKIFYRLENDSKSNHFSN